MEATTTTRAREGCRQVEQACLGCALRHSVCCRRGGRLESTNIFYIHTCVRRKGAAAAGVLSKWIGQQHACALQAPKSGATPPPAVCVPVPGDVVLLSSAGRIRKQVAPPHSRHHISGCHFVQLPNVPAWHVELIQACNQAVVPAALALTHSLTHVHSATCPVECGQLHHRQALITCASTAWRPVLGERSCQAS